MSQKDLSGFASLSLASFYLELLAMSGVFLEAIHVKGEATAQIYAWIFTHVHSPQAAAF